MSQIRYSLRNHHVSRSVARLVIVALVILYAAGCEGRYRETKFLMSTIVEITAVGSEDSCQRAMELAFEEIRRIDSLMNVYGKTSEVSQINEAAGESAVEVSVDTMAVVSRAIDLARITDGALDITIAPLMDLWGFRNGSKQVPLDDELREKLSLVNYREVVLDSDRSTIKLSSAGMEIDVSGIAKGYAVDRAIQVMRGAGIRNALVNAGGDLYAMGSPPGKESWRIGIRHPRSSAELLGILELKDRAVATSGDYENFFEADGKRYCHIIDTRTGRPVEGILSVTIVADSAVEADALATAVFPMGAEAGMELIESLQGIDGMIVTGYSKDDMKTLISSGMKDGVHLEVY